MKKVDKEEVKKVDKEEVKKVKKVEKEVGTMILSSSYPIMWLYLRLEGAVGEEGR